MEENDNEYQRSPEIRDEMLGFNDYSKSTTAVINGHAYQNYGADLPHMAYNDYGVRPLYPIEPQYGSYSSYPYGELPADVSAISTPTYIETGDISFSSPLNDLPYQGHEQFYAHSYKTISPNLSTGSNGSDSDGRLEQKQKRKRVQSMHQRKAANVRERRRMGSLNEAMDQLRKRLPAFKYEKRLSRIETLRLAMTYISFMTNVSDGKDPKDVALLKGPRLDDNENYRSGPASDYVCV